MASDAWLQNQEDKLMRQRGKYIFSGRRRRRQCWRTPGLYHHLAVAQFSLHVHSLAMVSPSSHGWIYIFNIHYSRSTFQRQEEIKKKKLYRELFFLERKIKNKIQDHEKSETKTTTRNNPPVFHPLSHSVTVSAKWQDAKVVKKLK